MNIALIFPHQLFEQTSLLDHLDKARDTVFLVEDYLFFSQYRFHSQKLILHRASLKQYEQYILNLGYQVEYLEAQQLKSRSSLAELLAPLKIQTLYVYQVIDTWLQQDIELFAKAHSIQIHWLTTPLFLNSDSENREFFATQKKPFMKTFYQWQRQRLDILMQNQKPVGGKYSFDTENRKKLPKSYQESPRDSLKFQNQSVELAQIYIQQYFPDSLGNSSSFVYATNFEQAKQVLDYFLEYNLQNFGIYEDAISSKYGFINHSVLSPYLNIGLLTPEYILTRTLAYVENHPHTIPLNSLEGFIRQIIGWREFIRAMYDIYGSKMRTTNFFQHSKQLEPGWWTGQTGILPVDIVINRLLESGYCHHIERLMILGNYMLLSEYDPDQVYQWFMEMFIDSYDWVMVPNIYGMSQFADGGIFATKPYISGSNYILKMSDYRRESGQSSWDTIWDQKFWYFLAKHKPFFHQNPRFRMLLSRLKN